MSAMAITYRTGTEASALRTVIVEDARTSVIFLPTGSLNVVQAKLQHGTTCAHSFWADELGLDPDSDDFIVPADQVVQQRPISIAVKARHK
jgi:hypothetical protein